MQRRQAAEGACEVGGATARGRGIQRGRGRGIGRRGDDGEMQEVPGGAYIQFQV
jgi:hypothetical protein